MPDMSMPTAPSFQQDKDAFNTATTAYFLALNALAQQINNIIPATLCGSPEYILIQDQKVQGTASTSKTSGSWQVLTLNTEVVDTGGLATLATNQITLQPGTYRFRGECLYAGWVGNLSCRLYNVTTGAAITTNAAIETSGAGGNANIHGLFIIADSSILELQYYCTGSGGDLGVASNIDDTIEIYAQIEFWRESHNG